MAKFDTSFLPGEKIFMEDGANLIINGGANSRGGHVALTNYRVMFQAHGFNFGKKFEEFQLKYIKRNDQGAYIVFVRGNDLIIQMNDGTVAQFVMFKGKAEMLMNSIETQLLRISASNTPAEPIPSAPIPTPHPTVTTDDVKQNAALPQHQSESASSASTHPEEWSEEWIKARGYKSASEAYLDMTRKEEQHSPITENTEIPVAPPHQESTLSQPNEPKKGFFGKAADSMYKKRQDWAVKAAIREEEEKRKAHVKTIEHQRQLTPTEEQTVIMLDLKAKEYDMKFWDTKDGRFLSMAMDCREQIDQIKGVWYEEVTIPPEVDPSVPIEIDEEAIRNSVKRWF